MCEKEKILPRGKGGPEDESLLVVGVARRKRLQLDDESRLDVVLRDGCSISAGASNDEISMSVGEVRTVQLAEHDAGIVAKSAE